MGKPPRYKSRSASKSRRPVTADDAAERVKKFVVQLFIRDDGLAVDWSIIAEALLKAAFHALDRMSDSRRVYKLLRRVEMGVYDRLTALATEPYVDAGPAPFAPLPDLEGPQAHFSDVVQ